ncbi:MAG: YoaK family protein [Rhodanobacteraceae bacterium]
MINKLPRWVLLGGIVLSFIGGMVNAAGYLSFRHQAVTHMTGTTTLLGIGVARGDVGDMLKFGIVALAFLLGAALGGFIVRDSALRLGRRYGVALSVESLLLFAAVPLLVADHDSGLWLAAAACGLQNAMAGTYSGAVVRTTHVSGLYTDLGMFLGQWLGGVRMDARRVRLYVTLVIGFFIGGVTDALIFPRLGQYGLLLPAALTGLVGVAYTAYRHRTLQTVPG